MNLYGVIDVFDPVCKIDLDDATVKRLKSFRKSLGKHLKTKFYYLNRDVLDREEVVSWLFQHHSNNFDLWWDPQRIFVYQWSNLLSNKHMTIAHFDLWWDAEKFDWTKGYRLAKNLDDETFLSIWDASKIKWNTDLFYVLCTSKPHLIDTWFDKDAIDESYYPFMIAHLGSEYLDYWYKSELFDDKNYYELCLISLIKSDIPITFWWRDDYDKDIDYSKYLSDFIMYRKSEFSFWWKHINVTYSLYERYFYALLKHFSTKEYFDLWWNSEYTVTFLRQEGPGSYIPAIIKNVHHFDLWFPVVQKYINWTSYNIIEHFCVHLTDKFEIWFDYKKFQYSTLSECSHNAWGEKPRGLEFLIKYCSDHVNIWWDSRRIKPHEKNFDLLYKYGQSYKEFWQSQYVIYQLKKESSKTNINDLM